MSRVDLLLVTTPSFEGVYQGLSKFAAVEPPVWSGLLARHCMNAGYRVEILDAEAAGLNDFETACRIKETNPVLAAFSIYGHQPSASTQSMPGALAVANMVESMAPHIPKLAFGTHPSALPEKTLWEGFDYVCQGEGVYTLPALLLMLHQGLKLSQVPLHLRAPGLWWSPSKDEGRVALSVPAAPVVKSLDTELPNQAWELLDMRRYRPHHWHAWTGQPDGGYASVQTSLGCPFRCSFCCINAPFGGSGIRYWSPANIAAQIANLVDKHGITNIKIPDEMFFLNRQHVGQICNMLIDMGLGEKLNMWAYARIDTVKDEQLLEHARKAGFRWLALGIESASENVRDGVEKGRFDNEDILAACARVEKAGLHIAANYIFGLPDDTHESMKQTLALAYEINAPYANLYCAMAYPGSALHGLAQRNKWQLPEDHTWPRPGWIGYSQHSEFSLPLPTETLSYKEVLDFRDNAFMLYHTRPEFLAKLLRSFGSEAVETVKRITALGQPKRFHRQPPIPWGDEHSTDDIPF